MDLDYRELDMQLANANDEIKELRAKCEAKRNALKEIQVVAQWQRNDTELWRQAGTPLELRMQQALRQLHLLILNHELPK